MLRGGVLTWLLGVVLALLTWRVAFGPPGPGIDLSWHAGLAMATEQGLHYGPEVVFTYGPLGFLSLPGMWEEGLSVLSFCYEAVLAIVFAVALLWALRRSLSIGAAVLTALLVLAFLPSIEQPVALAVIVSLGMLDRGRRPLGLTAFIVGGASLAAVEALIKISLGPLIFAVVLIALIGARTRWWQLVGFAGLTVVELVLLWLISGQTVTDLPDFATNSLQVISGYNDAMGLRGLSSAFYLAALAPFGVVVGGFFGAYRDDRARWAGVALLAVSIFALFKEGVVRFDQAPLALYIPTACAFWLAIPWSVGQRWLLMSGAAVLGLITVHVLPPAGGELDPVANLRLAGDQFRTLFSHDRRADLEEIGRQGLKQTYRLDRRPLADLRGHSVTVDPWEIGVAWAYDLDWEPLPIFQNYSAYTRELDQLNADAL